MKNDIDILATHLGDSLARLNLHVTCAESCTGGAVGAAITSVEGSSEWFDMGFITYSNEAKAGLLNVSASLIDQHGAVSHEVAEAMAVGASKVACAELAVSVSGIAGPGGGTIKKPVGTVYIAWCYAGVVRSQCFSFTGDRQTVREQAIHQALQGLIASVEA
ncbi:MAG: nicotinamide-nucleotide amidase [Flavobacteriales bacterium]|jgi:nicotinamide-nucleotide amidase